MVRATRVNGPPEVRFWKKVEESADGCWIWKAARQPNGYGRFGTGEGAKAALAHRWSYEQMVGDIPEGFVIDHLCRNPACVRPDHLDAVPQRINVRRGDLVRLGRPERRAQTHCKRGDHPLSGENLRVDKRGRRSCRTCWRDQDRERKRQLRALKLGVKNG